MPRKILHVDMNSFYASVELLERPDLKNKPVAVGGDESQRHGIVLAKNEPAKAYGIQTAETIYQAKQKCPHLVILPAHHEKYAYYSQKAREIYLQYTDKVQGFGPDEAWLDLTERPESGMDLAHEIQNRVLDELGLTVSVGVSWNKTFAKLGSDYKKPFAITEINQQNFREIVWPLPVGDLLFVGNKTEQKLRSIGVETIGELARLDIEDAEAFLGKNGRTLVLHARGIDNDPVLTREEQGPAKSVSSMRTTVHDLVKPEDIDKLLNLLSEEVERRLQKQNMRSWTIRVYVRDKDFNNYSKQKSLSSPVEKKEDILRVSEEIFKEGFSDLGPIRLLGVTADNLENKEVPVQMSFADFNSPINDSETANKEEIETESETAKAEKEITSVLQELQEKFGEDSVFWGNNL